MGISDELEKIVGPHRVVTDKAALRTFSHDASFTMGQPPQCLVRPRSLTEVQGIVQFANAKGVPLVACSSAGMRFRGDTVPQASKSVIVDMSGMQTILRLDVRNKVAMIEPGVTFDALQQAARQNGLRLPMPLTPRREKSVIGSILEREPHTIPKYHWDASDPLCCLEVVFGSGDLFRTGSAAGPGTLEEQWASGQAQKSPMGPSQTDFMKIVQGAQGTMGIVTWATVKLELLPKAQKAFFVTAERLEGLLDFTYSILRPRLPDECLILNHTALASIIGRHVEERDALVRDLPPWILFYALAGYEHFPQERIAYLEADIADIAQRTNVRLRSSIGGVPAQQFLTLLTRSSDDPYWKIRHRGGCQEIFFLSTLDRTPDFQSAFAAECAQQDFPISEVGIYLQPMQQGRTVHVEFDCMYPHDPVATTRIKNLYQNASRSIAALGGFYSRPYGQWAEVAYDRCPDTVQALRKVKAILDPRGIMNPGKLCFPERS